MARPGLPMWSPGTNVFALKTKIETRGIDWHEVNLNTVTLIQLCFEHKDIHRMLSIDDGIQKCIRKNTAHNNK